MGGQICTSTIHKCENTDFRKVVLLLQYWPSVHSCETGSNLPYNCPIVTAFGLMILYHTCNQLGHYLSLDNHAWANTVYPEQSASERAVWSEYVLLAIQCHAGGGFGHYWIVKQACSNQPFPLSGLIQQMTNWWYFSYLSQEKGFDISCKLSPKETICMKCRILFSGKKIRKIFQILSASTIYTALSKLCASVEWLHLQGIWTICFPSHWQWELGWGVEWGDF